MSLQRQVSLGTIRKTIVISAANSSLPSYVTESVAEIENLPGVAFGKSIGGIINEGTLDLAVGCTGLSFTDVQSCHEPMSYYEKIFSAISNVRPYWEKLAGISKSAYRAGVSIYWGESPEMRPLKKEDTPFLWDKILREADTSLLRLGVPLTYDPRGNGIYLIHHDTVDGLTDKDLAFLLTQPVITDGESVAKIIKRGYGKHFAFTTQYIGNNTEEHFTDNPITGDMSILFYNENPISSKPMKRVIFENVDHRTVILGNAYNGHFLSDGRLLGPCTVVTEIQHAKNEPPVKWAIFGYSIWSDIVSAAKRNQILSALDAIGDIPARILSDEQAVIYISVNEQRKTVALTISAASQNGAQDLKIAVRNPNGTRISALSTKNESPKFSVEAKKDGELLITIQSMVPYETLTLFFE